MTILLGFKLTLIIVTIFFIGFTARGIMEARRVRKALLWVGSLPKSKTVGEAMFKQGFLTATGFMSGMQNKLSQNPFDDDSVSSNP